jgi:hypothetical protein
MVHPVERQAPYHDLFDKTAAGPYLAKQTHLIRMAGFRHQLVSMRAALHMPEDSALFPGRQLAAYRSFGRSADGDRPWEPRSAGEQPKWSAPLSSEGMHDFAALAAI